MRPSIKNLLVLAPVIFLLASCGGKKASVPVPKDAAIVMHFNMASLSSKLPWSEIKSAEWFKMIAEEAEEDEEMTPLQKSLLENPENSGVDLKSDLYFFMQVKGKNAYAVVSGKLSDAKKFESTIQGISEMLRIKKDGSISYLGNEEGCLTWTSNRFIFVAPTKAPGSDFGPRRRYYDEEDEDEDRDEEQNFESLLQFAKDVHGLKQSNSISSDSHFSSLMKETGDIHLFFASNAFMQDAMGPLRMLKASSLLEGNAAGLAINFDNGKVSVNSKSWYGKELGELMKKYQPGNLNADMLKRIPSQNLAGVLAMNYPPEGIKEFIKILGAEGLVNGFMSEAGVNIDDFVKANKGDVMVAVSDFSIKEKKITTQIGDESYTYSDTKPDANILFATSVKDKATFTKLMDAVKKEMNKNKNEDMETGEEEPKYVLTDSWFVMGNNQGTIDSFAAGRNTNSAALISQISGHPFGGFIDLQKIFAGISFPEEKGNWSLNERILLAAQNWENIIFYGGEMKDGATTGYFEINLKDKSTNSLKQFYSFIGQMVGEQRKNLMYRDEEVDIPPPAVMDSPVVEPKIENKK
ncbi:MAG: DUF4836 family protein [Chitinophagaceae bacterium]|nr:DUF4836 family protein [Chitinophagaceae bacterium]